MKNIWMQSKISDQKFTVCEQFQNRCETFSIRQQNEQSNSKYYLHLKMNILLSRTCELI